MDSSNKNTFAFAVFANLAVVLLVSLGFFAEEPRIVSNRPAVPGGATPEEEAGALARLWQEPFEAIANAKNAGKSVPDVAKSKVVFLLPRDQPYADERERRIRLRYALHTAAQDTGYVPLDTERLQFAEVNVRGRTHAAPYEQFSGPYGKLTVFWIGENWLDAQDMNSDITEVAASLGVPTQGIVEIVGPGSSSVLRSLVDSLTPTVDRTAEQQVKQTALQAKYPEKVPGWRVWSPYATAAMDFPAEWPPGRGVIRTVPDDNQVCESLIDELVMRDRLPSGETNGQRTLIIHEWDTAYGRQLAESFEKKLAGHFQAAQSETDLPDPQRAARRAILRTHFLRGLDGVHPGQSSSAKKVPIAEADEKDGDKKPKIATIAEGGSQLDYMRRLAQHWSEQDEAMRLQGRGSISSIGIFASDIYDKLVVLSAFRKVFPRATIFTTDLDAAYLDPALFDHTRNLVCAASDALMVRGKQRGGRSFRDSLQSAAYRTLVHLFREKDIATPGVVNWKLEPLSKRRVDLWEIGRHAAVQLTFTAAEDARERQWSARSSATAFTFQAWLGCYAFALLLLVPFFTCYACTHWGRSRKRDAIVSLATLVAAFFLTLISRHWFLVNLETRDVWLFYRLVAFLWFVIIGCVLALVATDVGQRDPSRKRDGDEPPETWFSRAIRGTTSWLVRSPSDRPLRRTARFVIAAVFAACWGAPLILWFVLRFATELSAEPFSWRQGISIWPSVLIQAMVIVLTIAGLWHGSIQVSISINRFGERFAPDRPDRHALDEERKAWEDYSGSIAGFWRLAALTAVAVLLSVLFCYLTDFPDPPVRGAWPRTIQVIFATLGYIVTAFAVLFVLNHVRISIRLARALVRTVSMKDGLPAEETVRIIGGITHAVGNLLYIPLLATVAMLYSTNDQFDYWSGNRSLTAGYLVIALVVIAGAYLMQRAARRVKGEAISYFEAEVRDAHALELQLTRPWPPAANSEADLAGRMRQYAADFRGAGQPDPEGMHFDGPITPDALDRCAAHFQSRADAQAAQMDATQAKKEDEDALESVVHARRADSAHQSARIARATRLMEQIRGIREGAFAGILQNPIVTALGLPVGGYSILTLVGKLTS